MLPPDGSTLHEPSVNAVYVSLYALVSRQWTSVLLKSDIQGGVLWLWVPMTRVGRRRVLRDMLEDLDMWSGWAMWFVGKEV